MSKLHRKVEEFLNTPAIRKEREEMAQIELGNQGFDLETEYMLELAYWAGFFDGEGYIGIYKYKQNDGYHKSPGYSVVMGLTLTNKKIVEEFGCLFKGFQITRREYKRNPNAKTQYYWQAKGHTAIAVLKALMPFLKLKKRQAELAIEFYERKGPNPSRPLTNSELQLREEYYQKMRQLNKRGRKHD